MLLSWTVKDLNCRGNDQIEIMWGSMQGVNTCYILCINVSHSTHRYYRTWFDFLGQVPNGTDPEGKVIQEKIKKKKI